MADESFDRAISQSLRIAKASTGANLAGFRLDLAYALEQKAGFSTINVITTGNPRCMLRAICSAQPAVDVAAVLAQTWEEELRYAPFANRRIRHAGPTTDLEFVTRSAGPDPLCVTGLISVTQPGAEGQG